jgi:2-keto-4-pentenoate hydratase
MSDGTTQAAQLLLAARRDAGKKPADLPAGLKPADRASAYAIQHKVMAELGAIGGWKVSPFGADGAAPMCGPLPASGVQASPVTLRPGATAQRAVESELCARIGKDLPPRGTPFSRDEVAAAIAAIHPVIEACESRYVEPREVDAFSSIADTQSHFGLIYGTGREDWQGIDLAAVSVEQLVDGVVNAGRTGHPAGDLVAQVVWMANEGAVWAGGLKAGQFVTCGSWTGANRVAPTAKVVTRFSGFAEVVVSYAV